MPSSVYQADRVFPVIRVPLSTETSPLTDIHVRLYLPIMSGGNRPGNPADSLLTIQKYELTDTRRILHLVFTD